MNHSREFELSDDPAFKKEVVPDNYTMPGRFPIKGKINPSNYKPKENESYQE